MATLSPPIKGRNWTSLHASKVAHAKFVAKSDSTRFSVKELVDLAADYIGSLTPSQIARLIEDKSNTATKGRKGGGK